MRTKFRREVDRLKWQLANTTDILFGGVLRAAYDRKRPMLVSQVQGDVPVAREVAILLIYQPEFLPKSLFHTLNHLREKGIAPVVVSNAPLTSVSRAQLLPQCHLIVERPNYGYDFGGYREGILILSERGINPDALYLLNDSMWFPLREDCALIDHARASKADLFGIYQVEWPDKPHRTHLQSYFYRFKRPLLGSAAFDQYWRRLMMSDDKRRVVLKCEGALTHAFRKQGFSTEALYHEDDIKAAALALTGDDLTAYLRYAALVDPAVGAPETAARTIATGVLRKNLMGSHPLISVRALNIPVLKKDRAPLWQAQRSEIFRLGLDVGFAPVIREELKSRDVS